MVESQMVVTNEQWTNTVDKLYMAQFAEIDQLLREGKEKAAADIIAFKFGSFGKWRSANVLLAFYKRFTEHANAFKMGINPA